MQSGYESLADVCMVNIFVPSIVLVMLFSKSSSFNFILELVLFVFCLEKYFPTLNLKDILLHILLVAP